MKHVLQNLKSGEIELVDTVVPSPKPAHVLVRSSVSLVSPGTERMLMRFGSAGYIGKALQQPERVRQVLQKIGTDGVMSTASAILTKLNSPIPLGYCNVGIVVQSSSSEFRVGDRVVSNGSHAEFVRVPANLCAKIPDSVEDEAAVFTPLGSIALQGVRLVNPALGEFVVVQGLGLVGLLAVQLLLANGCQVLGVDINPERCLMAEKLGISTICPSSTESDLEIIRNLTNGIGADAVLICTATNDDSVVKFASRACRQRGRIVLIGVAGLNLDRDDFYKKEIKFQVSSSYGPGRYDTNYEDKGVDYPSGFVRWTAKRNFEAVLTLLSRGAMKLNDYVSARYSLSDIELAYEALRQASGLGLLIDYPLAKSVEINRPASIQPLPLRSPYFGPLNQRRIPEKIWGDISVGVIGAGNFASRTLLPELSKTGVNLRTLVSDQGLSGHHLGVKFGFQNVSTDVNDIWSDQQIDAVIIATRHGDHAEQVISGLAAHKHVYVEKPLCINLEELEQIKNCLIEARMNSGKNIFLTVGFNRRFAPHVMKLKALLNAYKAPKAFILTVNAGHIPIDHWTQDSEDGGGRIIGEACHFVDLLRYLSGSKIVESSISFMNSITNDTATINLKFDNGSIGSVHYFSNGSRQAVKEKLEVYSSGKILTLHNFLRMRGYGTLNFRKMNRWRQDKGHANCLRAFLSSIDQSGNRAEPPIPEEELFEISELIINLSQFRTPNVS